MAEKLMYMFNDDTQKLTFSIDYNYWLKRLNTHFIESTNQKSTNKKTLLKKTLGTSAINIPVHPISMSNHALFALFKKITKIHSYKALLNNQTFDSKAIDHSIDLLEIKKFALNFLNSNFLYSLPIFSFTIQNQNIQKPW